MNNGCWNIGVDGTELMMPAIHSDLIIHLLVAAGETEDCSVCVYVAVDMRIAN